MRYTLGTSSSDLGLARPTTWYWWNCTHPTQPPHQQAAAERPPRHAGEPNQAALTQFSHTSCRNNQRLLRSPRSDQLLQHEDCKNPFNDRCNPLRLPLPGQIEVAHPESGRHGCHRHQQERGRRCCRGEVLYPAPTARVIKKRYFGECCSLVQSFAYGCFSVSGKLLKTTDSSTLT